MASITLEPMVLVVMVAMVEAFTTLAAALVVVASTPMDKLLLEAPHKADSHS
jgi:hypothetical protein